PVICPPLVRASPHPCRNRACSRGSRTRRRDPRTSRTRFPARPGKRLRTLDTSPTSLAPAASRTTSARRGALPCAHGSQGVRGRWPVRPPKPARGAAPSLGSSLRQQIAGDHHALDLRGSLVDLEQLGVPHQFLDGIFLGVTISAE